MDSTDLVQRQRRARLAYELGRVRLALLGIAPLLILIAAAVWLGERPAAALAFGSATLALGAGMLWYGRDPQRAVLPGIAAGMVPLAFALCANKMYACGADGCSSLCVPACTLGGVVAGLAVAGVGNQRRAGPAFWLSACGLALLTGAMGCTCIGSSGVVGLGVGIAAGVVPGLLRRTFRRAS
jgi:hypothetical protein